MPNLFDIATDKQLILGGLRELKDGWNSYSAPAPTEETIRHAGLLLDAIKAQPALEVAHIGASVVGGVGFTFERGDREYVVEFVNDGDVVKTLITGGGKNPDIRVDRFPVADPYRYRYIVNEAIEFLAEGAE